jgi:hypothetical protein
VTLRRRKIHLNVGKVITCGFYPDNVWVSLLTSAMDVDDLAVIGADKDVRENERFKTVPGGIAYWVKPSALGRLRTNLGAGFEGFVKAAARSSSKVVQWGTHSPGVLQYLEAELGRSLPRPSYASGDEAPLASPDPAPPPKAVAVVQPRIQFTETRYDLDGLLKYIELGDIALPDIQRPFVWTKTKVRDFFDSLYRGFPVGSLMFWATTAENGETRKIGLEPRQRRASLLVVDGQQRLTSLYAVMRRKPVLDDTFKETFLEIAFRPRDGTFDVSDVATRNDPEFIPNISLFWTSNKPARRLINEFVDALRSKRDITAEDEDAISHNLDRLFDLSKYPFTTLEIAKDVDEEAVADIFVRINNGGSKLGQSDFILTLLSVFSPETREALEDFSRRAQVPSAEGRPSPFNHIIQPGPDQLVRVAIALGFHRARLKAVYQLLRGKDVETGIVSAKHREEQFRRLEEATPKVLDLNSWHRYLACIVGAGFRSGALISSENAILNSYALFLIGKHQCGVDDKTLGRLIARWFFAASLSGRYSGSSETIMEEDLALVKSLGDPESFANAFEKALASVVTNDFWETTLPHELQTSSVNSPAARAYLAAQIKLGAPILFSDRRIADLYDPAIRSERTTLEGHHLFPRSWLKEHGIRDTKHVNQAANLAYVEWPDNLDAGGEPPAEYLPRLRERFSTSTWDVMCAAHALPLGWENMSYDTFLSERRKLMARIIRRGFAALGDAESSSPEAMIFAGADEREAWHHIEEVELALRKLVRSTYDARFGGGADTKIKSRFSEKELADLEGHRARHEAAYPLSPRNHGAELLDYCYLGQLVKLIHSDDVWSEVRGLFRGRKEVLQELVAKISPVRNDRAHFRPVPEKELQRCVLACDDLLTMIRASRPAASAS